MERGRHAELANAELPMVIVGRRLGFDEIDKVSMGGLEIGDDGPKLSALGFA